MNNYGLIILSEEDLNTSHVSLRSQKSGSTMFVVDDGTAHDAGDLELAADNLEAQLDEEEEDGVEEREKEEQDARGEDKEVEDKAEKKDDDIDENDRDDEDDKDVDVEKVSVPSFMRKNRQWFSSKENAHEATFDNFPIIFLIFLGCGGSRR